MKKFMLLLTLLVLNVGVLVAQTKVVSGMVISSEDNQPVIGATVRAKSSAAHGATTDLDGKFRFNVPSNETHILVSYVGMKTQEVAVGTNLRIVLRPDQELLDEVVVIGYGTGTKIGNTSASVVKVSSKELESKPVANPFDAVQGKVSGLQVFTSSGEPAEISSIRLHGAGSLGASSTPLYVLDGVPVSAGTVMSMNPNDFESMQVLKDAAATSIYGARAANGVIYITTKRGRQGERGKITVRGQYGVSSLANPDFYESFMTADELANFWVTSGYRTQDQIDALREKFPHDTKWYKYYFKDAAPMYQGDVAFSGGSKNTSYYISTGLLNQDGLRYRSLYERYTLRGNISSTINPIVKVGLNNAITYDIVQTNPYGWNYLSGGLSPMALPFYSPYDENGDDYYDKGRIPGWNQWSPKYLADIMPAWNKSLAFNSSANITITPMKGMTLRSQIGLELTDFTYDYTRYPSYPNQLGNGMRSRQFSRTIGWTVTNTGEYKFNIGDDNHFTTLIGQEFIKSDYEFFSGEGTGLTDDRLIMLGQVTEDKSVSESFSQYAFFSLFGQLSYDYLEKYFIDLTLRNDASSRFGSANKNATFWSAGTMWKAKKEAFLSDVNWLDNLSVKFSIGTSGNAGIGNYAHLALVGKSGQYEANSGWALSSAGNPNLTWEQQLKTTFGVDFRIFDFLSMNIELYNRQTTAMLMDVPYPFTSGFSSNTENVGKYENKGIDIKAEIDIWKDRTRTNYLSFYTNFNYNTDKVTELFQGLDHWIIPNTGVCYVVGQPVMFFYPLWKGVNPETGAPEWYLPGENISITQKDDSQITSRFGDYLDQNTGIRRFAPINGGFGINGQYKGFYLQADFAYVLGKHLISNDAYFFEQNPAVFGMNSRKIVADFWKQPGDQTQFPSMNYLFSELDSRMIRDASFMRLKNLTLGYTVPSSILSKQNILQGAKVFFTGRNLLTFTKFDGPDPEIDSNLSLGANPNTKQISVGVELTF